MTAVPNEHGQTMELPRQVTVVEVGPRDGLQSLERWIPTDQKIDLVDRLSASGLPVIEVTSFAHPDVVPNLRDADEVMSRIERRPGVVYRALVPNEKGARRAVQAEVDEILGLMTVSETYTQKNQNMSVEEALLQGVSAFEIAAEAGIDFTMAVGMAFFCPYEGRIAEQRTIKVVERLFSLGVRRLYLAGSMGVEDPRHVNAIIHQLSVELPDLEVGFHVHNLAGFGLANVLAALNGGATRVESSILGMGGGIAMPGALPVHNVATEDLINMLNEMEIDTGVDTSAVLAAARGIADMLGVSPLSHLAATGTRSDLLANAGVGPNPQVST